jgi:hypothetical protein
MGFAPPMHILGSNFTHLAKPRHHRRHGPKGNVKRVNNPPSRPVPKPLPPPINTVSSTPAQTPPIQDIIKSVVEVISNEPPPSVILPTINTPPSAPVAVPVKDMIKAVGEVISNVPIPNNIPSDVSNSWMPLVGTVGKFMWDRTKELILSYAANKAQEIIVEKTVNFFISKKEDNLKKVAEEVESFDPILEKYTRLFHVLKLLVSQFQEKINEREQTLDEVLREVVTGIETTECLNKTVGEITEEDIEGVLRVMNRELETVVNRFGNNIEMLPKIVEEIVLAKKELSKNQNELKKAKEELASVAYELEAVKLLFVLEGVEMGKTIDTIINKTGVLNV